MAASDYITPTPPLLPGTTAKAQDVNEKFDALIAAFNKLPIPAAGGAKGFAQAVEVGDATSDEHALTKGQFDAVIEPIQFAINQVLALATKVNPYAEIKVIDDAVYVVTAEDNGKILWFTSALPVDVVFPGQAEMPFSESFQGVIIQAGDGEVTCNSDGQSNVLASGELYSTSRKYAPMSYMRIDDNNWWLGGERA